jgi:hypothetical protein
MATQQGRRYNLNAPAVVSATAARAIPVDSDDGRSTWLAIRSIRKETELASITRGGNYVALSGTCTEQCAGGSIGQIWRYSRDPDERTAPLTSLRPLGRRYVSLEEGPWHFDLEFAASPTEC